MLQDKVSTTDTTHEIDVLALQVLGYRYRVTRKDHLYGLEGYIGE